MRRPSPSSESLCFASAIQIFVLKSGLIIVAEIAGLSGVSSRWRAARVSAPRTSDEMYLRRAYRRDHRVQLLDVSLGNPQRFFAGVRLVVASDLVVEVHRPVLRDTLRHRLERFLVAARPAVDVERRMPPSPSWP